MSGKLTAEQVREVIERHSDESGGNGRDFHNGAYVAIADELNAALGAGKCELTLDGTDGCFGCSECLENIPPLANYCPNCGKAVKR